MSQDYIALEWVKGEIQETLQQAQQSLEAYGENPQDKSRLKFCFSYLHQVRGTLQMVEFYGAALLAEEMEAVAEGLAESTLASEHDGLQVLMQAIIQLPHYLDHVKVGRRDLPIVLLPILNELRSVRGEALLSETALFSPRMVRRAVLRSDQLKRFRTEEFQQWIRKVRQMFQTATLQLFQGKDAAAAKDYLRKVFERLHTTLGHTPNGVIWQPAMAFAEWLVGQKSIPGSAKQHLRDIDLMLKALILEGADQLNQPAQDELVKNLLFFVARTKVNGPAIRAVQEAFALENALPSEAEIQKERDALAGPDRATISQVLSALIEEITAIKDKLDLAVRDGGSRGALLQEAQPSAKQVCDTMAMLGLGMPRDVIQEQLNTLNNMIATGESQDQQLQDMAGALLYVEATLANMIREGQLDLRVAAGSLTEEQKAVLREARNALEQVKDAIIAYVANQWDASELRSVPQLLRSIAGSLAMVPLESVSFVLRHAAPFVEDIIQNGTRIDWTTLDNFADVLSGVEYYLERYSENPHNAGEDILSRANGALARLPGVQLPKPEPVAPVAESVPAEKPAVAQAPVAAPKPAMEAAVAAPQPAIVAEQPVAVAEEPVVVAKEPVAVAEEPVVVAEQPVVVAEQPVAVAEEPVVVAEQPVAVAEQPVAVAEQPVVVADEPVAVVEEPVVVAEEPVAVVEEPVVVAEEPVAVVEEPVAVAEEPVVVAEEPAVVVEAPVTIAPAPVAAAPVRPAAPAYDMVKAPPVAEPEDSDLIDDEIIEIFLEEAEEVTATLDEYWPQFRANPQNNEAMTTVRRAFHTLKGSGRMVQAMVIGELAWSIENMFNRVIDKTINVSDNMMDIVQHVLENLPLLIDDFRCRRGASINTQPLMDYAFTIAAGKPVPALEQYLKADDVPVADAPVTAHGRESATASTRPDGSADADEDDRAAQYEGSSDTDASDLAVVTAETTAEQPLVAEAVVVEEPIVSAEPVVADESAQLVEPEVAPEPAVAPVIEAEDDDEDLALIDVFVQEANGHLDVVNRFVAESASANYENPLGDQVQRALHTLKGSAHMAGIAAIANLASPLERLLKEFRAYQVGNSRELTELVRDGAAMIGSALRDKARLHSGMISGNQTYLRRIEQIERTLLLPIMEEADRTDNVPNPQAIAQFLEQGMDSLLDAEQLIRRWQDMGDDSVLSTLCSDLVAVAGGAEQAEQPRIAELCSALYEFYREILSSGQAPRPEWLTLALNGQEELLNMMDCLAAGQVLEVPEVLEGIRAVANQLSVENLLKAPAPAISEEEGLDVLNAILDDSADDGAHDALLGLLDAGDSLDHEPLVSEPDVAEPAVAEINTPASDWTASVYEMPTLGSDDEAVTPVTGIEADIQRLLNEQIGAHTDAAESLASELSLVADSGLSLEDLVAGVDNEPLVETEPVIQELIVDEPVIAEPLVLEQEPSELVSEELVYDLPVDTSELLQEPLVEEPLVLNPSDLVSEELVYDLPVDNTELLLQEPMVEEPLAEALIVDDLVADEPLVLEQEPSDLLSDELVYDLPVDTSERLLQEPLVEEALVLNPSDLVSEELVYDLPVDNSERLLQEPLIEEPLIEELLSEAPISAEPLVLEQEPYDLASDELVYDLPIDNSELLLQEPLIEEPLSEALMVEEPLVLEQEPSDLVSDELVYDLPVDNSELLAQEPMAADDQSEELVYDLPYDINSLMIEPVEADDVTLTADPVVADVVSDDALTLDVSFEYDTPIAEESLLSAEDMLPGEEPVADALAEPVADESMAFESIPVQDDMIVEDDDAFEMPDTSGFNLNDVMAAHMAEPQPMPVVEAEPEFVAPASEPVANYQADSEHDAEVDEILEIFLEEAEEIIESVERTLNDWRDDPENLVSVARLQRDLHTLKGGARMAEQPAVAELCHELETLYERINNGRLGVENGLFNLLQAAHDDLGGQLDAIRHGDKPASAESIMATLSAYMSGDSSGLASISAPVAAPVAETVAAVVPEVITSTPEVISAPVVAADQIFSESLDEADREILEIFLEEAQELQEALEKTLHDWKSQPEERDAAAETQRVLHTLKGGARLAGLMDLGNLAHDFETDITHVLQGSRLLDDAFFDLAYQRQDAIVRRIEEVARIMASGDLIMLNNSGIQTTGHESNPALPEVTALASPQVEAVPQEAMPSNVVSLRPQAAAPARVAEESAAVVNAPASLTGLSLPDPMANRKAPQELVKVSADLLDDLVNLAGETSIGRGRLEQQVTDFAHTLEEMEMTLDRLRDQLRRLDIETEAQVLFRQERQGPAYEDFDPLEMDRYSTMQQLSRALVESASDLLDLKDTLANKTRDAETLLLQQSRINTELQEGLMKTRMVPFQRLVPRLRRIVRQISQELDKQVDFRVVNADGELDRTILERMISPLEHMVRNAVDHGIEMPADRARNGKNEMGIIELAVTREGGDVVLTLSDDGRGVNREAVRRKAIERGLLEPNAQVDDYELMQFILQAGFSTAKNVTQISGRGVGLDVVSTEIKQMGGAVEIQSIEGQGTRFVVRLPFTVSVNRALMVRTGDDLYAVPLNNIQGIVRVSVNDLQEFYSKPRAERGYRYGGRDYRLEYLGVMLENESQPKVAAQNLPLPVLLVNGAVPYALQVDSVLGSREIVVKALGPQFAAVMGVSGGTILGDGSVVIILDLPAMIRAQATLEYQQAKLADRSLAEQRQEKSKRQARVLVVDDSVTVRKVTTRLLERHGFEVLTASDGVDAMATLQDHKPDVMLLDIEMPRMDGFEVASLVRHDSRLRDIPIIMITSRTGDKHRDRAMSIGVNEYMGKPFQEDNLLGALNKLLGREER